MPSARPRRMSSIWSVDLCNFSSAPVRTEMSRVGSNLTRSRPPLAGTSRLPTCAPISYYHYRVGRLHQTLDGVPLDPSGADLAAAQTASGAAHTTLHSRRPRGQTMVWGS